MGMKFILSQTPEPPGPEWVDRTSDTYWDGNNGTWNGTQWSESGPGMAFDVTGIWTSLFRPTQVRITGSTGGAGSSITLKDTLNAVIAGPESPASVVTMNITFTTANIDRLEVYGMSAVTKIEFLTS